MKNKNAIFFAVCAFVIVFCAAYVGMRQFGVALPKYYPTLHIWSAAKQGEAPGMGWYALFGASLAVAGAAGAACYAAFSASLRDGERREGLARVFTWLAVAASLFMVCYNVHHEYLSWFLPKR